MTELVKTHKTVSVGLKRYEASIAVTVSEARDLFDRDEDYDQQFCFHSQATSDKEWCLTLSYFGNIMGVVVNRDAKLPCVDILGGECVVALPSGDLNEYFTRGITTREDVCKLLEIIDIPDIPNEAFEIRCRVNYGLPIVEEDVIRCEMPTVERLMSRVATAYEDLFRLGVDSDIITFVVDDEEIRAHRAVLVARSPYFERMMKSGMVEAQTNRVAIVDADAQSFRAILRYLYCGKLPDDLADTATRMLPLADRYDLPELREGCLYWMEKGLAEENVCETLITADLFRCTKLKEKYLKRLNQWKGSMGEEVFHALMPYPKLLVEFVRAG